MLIRLMDKDELNEYYEGPCLRDGDCAIVSISCISIQSDIWGSTFHVPEEAVSDGDVTIEYAPERFYDVPLNCVSSIKVETQCSVTPVQQVLIDEHEATLRSIEFKLRCLRAYAEGAKMPDIVGFINDLLDEEQLHILGGKPYHD